MTDIIIIISNEKFLIDKELKPLLAKYIDEATKSFNFEKFSADEISAARVVESCQGFPVMADKRVVHVSRADLWKATELEVLATYFENPNPSTLLIIEAAKIDNRLKIWKDAAKKQYIRDLKSPTQKELPGWILSLAKSKGLTLDDGVAYLLAEQVGVHLGLIEIEIEKLALSVHPQNRISIEAVESLIGKHLIHTIFEFVEKFTEKKLGEAQKLLDEMLVMGETLPGMLALMGRHFRILLLAKEALNKGLAEHALAGVLKVPPFVVSKYVRQAKAVSQRALSKIYAAVLDADRKVKSSPIDKRLIMDHLMLAYTV